jgi:hypothetical protein
MTEPQDDGDDIVEESEADILPAQSDSQSSRRSRGRWLAVAAVAALLLLAALRRRLVISSNSTTVRRAA